MRRRDDGFTLIEILVVVTILGVLFGMVAVIAPIAFAKREETVTQARVTGVSVNIQQLASNNMLGWYPPTSMVRLRDANGAKVGKEVGEGNEMNRGIETVFVALHLKGLAIQTDLPDDAIGNTDDDQLPKNPTQLDGMARREILDAWGNPLAYFNSADYKKPDAYMKIQMNADNGGKVVTAKPWKRKTGLFINPRKFQVFSAGKDQIFNSPDDIGNWERGKPSEGPE